MRATASLLFTILAILWSPLAAAGDLAGFWKFDEGPGWIEVRFIDGVGSATVRRNDRFPERVGRQLLKDIKADGEGWTAQVYVERSEEYRDAKLALSDSGQLEIKVKVGFISRTLAWNRVSEVPLE